MDVKELENSLKSRLGNATKFIGIYSSDKLPNISYNTRPTVFIANTLKSSDSVNTMGHWVAFYIESLPNKRIIFFDSFGISPYNYINTGFPIFLKKYKLFEVFHFGTQFQPDFSFKCGLYVCMFIHYTSIYGINKFIRYIYKHLVLRK